MSNWLYIEVQIVPSLLDNEPLVLILASDDYGSQFTRHTPVEFIDHYPSPEELVNNVLEWDTFIGFEQTNKVEVLGFDETLNRCYKLTSE